MDRKLKEPFSKGAYFEVYEFWYLEGFKKSIELLRANEYYGHYADFMADWLEKHLTQEVTSDKATDK